MTIKSVDGKLNLFYFCDFGTREGGREGGKKGGRGGGGAVP